MGGYVANFTVYTMAMIGLICFAVFVYKKFTDGTMRSGDNKFLSVEDSMSLSPRKTLHVVRAGNEKFLIASDVDRTTLISKLGDLENSKRIEDLERFKGIELEKSQPVMNTNYKYNEQVVEPKVEMDIVLPTNTQPVHLEPVRGRNPNVRRGLDRRAGLEVARKTVASPKNMVTLDFETPQKHGFSPMKEMAMKINEL